MYYDGHADLYNIAARAARCGPDNAYEMPAADVERTQAEVETAFHSEDMGSGDDDDLADEQHASTALA